MTLCVLINYDSETASYSAVCPQLPGCASAGDTEEEALVNMREAIELYHIHGSHYVMKKGNLTLVVPVHGNRDLAPGLLHKLKKQGGLR